jgi:hypothetical protein
MIHKLLCVSLLAFGVTLSGCGEKRVVANLPPPPEKLACVANRDRPTIPPEYVIDWAKVRTVDQAKAEHLKYVAVIRTREGAITGYILRIEDRLFNCSSNMAWLRDYEKGISH